MAKTVSPIILKKWRDRLRQFFHLTRIDDEFKKNLEDLAVGMRAEKVYLYMKYFTRPLDMSTTDVKKRSLCEQYFTAAQSVFSDLEKLVTSGKYDQFYARRMQVTVNINHARRVFESTVLNRRD